MAELSIRDAFIHTPPAAVASVSGEGGVGKTTTCLLALRDAEVRTKRKDGVFRFEIGLTLRRKT